eukprot:3284986-Pyramimonas_sp.AAC.1
MLHLAPLLDKKARPGMGVVLPPPPPTRRDSPPPRPSGSDPRRRSARTRNPNLCCPSCASLD